VKKKGREFFMDGVISITKIVNRGRKAEGRKGRKEVPCGDLGAEKGGRKSPLGDLGAENPVG
jgi:hypothetical protein